MTTQNNTQIAETTVAEAVVAPAAEKKTKKNDGPTVLAFRRTVSPRHFFMFSTSSKDLDGTRLPVSVREEPLRGLNATMKSKDDEKAQAVLQVVETAQLPPHHDTLVLSGSILVTSVHNNIESCNVPAFKAKHNAVIEGAAAQGVISELARRYAIQIACGDWAWRNLLETTNAIVVVKVADKGLNVQFENFFVDVADPFNFNNPKYSAFKDNLTALANVIDAALSSNAQFGTLFEVEGFFNMGAGARVYPSQEWASESEKKESKNEWKGGEGVTRVLAKAEMDGQKVAFINDRKVGNALRRIDTWYGDTTRIAVEAYGGNSHASVALRSGKDSSIFGAIQKVWADGKLAENMVPYYVACVIRGGVFGVKD
ncbi:type I-F CRISPR-associated protein Csy3 [Nostoc sp. CHAB 5834]|nr:type I-F CRISPR-associated protein Csy3 [Nostoc sp. CHAB 5834]